MEELTNLIKEPCKRRTFVGVLHYGNYAQLKTLLTSIEGQIGCSDLVICVLDHNEREDFESHWENTVHNPKNPGYASGMNFLIQQAISGKYDFFLGMNSDLKLNNYCISELVNALDTTQNTVLQSILTGPDDKVKQASNVLLPHFHCSFSPERHRALELMDSGVHPTDFVCGALFGVDLARFKRSPVLFDEDFFLYHEDIDWSLRLKSMGHQIGVCSTSVARHLEGGSSNALGQLTLKSVLVRWNSLRLFLSKQSLGRSHFAMSVLWFWSRMLLVYGKQLLRV